MRQFLVENPPRTFEPHTPTSEKEFELQVLRVSNQLLPSYTVASWKPLIRDWYGKGAKPDLAMLSRDLESWYVIEVELATHSVRGHIAPQLETLGNGVYDSSLVPSLKRSFPFETIESLTQLVRREPGLLCIVDQYTERISRTCRYTGFELAVLEPFAGSEGGWAVFVEQLPIELSKTIAPGIYSLSRSERLGNSIVMLLPRDFPASYYKIRLPTQSDDHEPQFVQVQRFNRGPSIILPFDLVSEHNIARVEVIDPSRGIAQLILDS